MAGENIIFIDDWIAKVLAVMPWYLNVAFRFFGHLAGSMFVKTECWTMGRSGLGFSLRLERKYSFCLGTSPWRFSLSTRMAKLILTKQPSSKKERKHWRLMLARISSYTGTVEGELGLLFE
jgi:hypothetical protein